VTAANNSRSLFPARVSRERKPIVGKQVAGAGKRLKAWIKELLS
jgi:hypothetical protein